MSTSTIPAAPGRRSELTPCASANRLPVHLRLSVTDPAHRGGELLKTPNLGNPSPNEISNAGLCTAPARHAKLENWPPPQLAGDKA